MESERPPIILPFFHHGMHMIMPEGRVIKRPILNQELMVYFGQPFDSSSWVARAKFLGYSDEETRIYLTEQVFDCISKTKSLWYYGVMAQNLEHKRHTLAHLLAAAVLKLYPETKLTLGPATSTGFYYDMDFKDPIKDSDLLKIEKYMKKILPTWKEFTHKEVSAEEAREIFKGNEYKLELIEEITSRGEVITLYTVGEFTDLCRGGHLESPSKEIKDGEWKLDKIAGAYWRGDEKNKMLTRVYGLAFETKLTRLPDKIVTNYSSWSLTLYAVNHGNAKTKKLDDAEFDRF
jgi:hypothetical protein